jgi:glucose 1-dehydrogenase
LRQPDEASETEQHVHACVNRVQQAGVRDVLVQGDVAREKDVERARTLALEYAQRGIRVNGIAPGATVTPINRAWIDDPIKREQVESHIPMRHAGTADEMGAVACFLASDDAAYVTGQTIFVDGGLTLFPSFREPWSSE